MYKILAVLFFLVSTSTVHAEDITSEWVHCANEYGIGSPNECKWGDLRLVRFGNGSQWAYSEQFDRLAAYKCSKSNFPEPEFGWSGGPYRCEYSAYTLTEDVPKPNHCASRNDCSGFPHKLFKGQDGSSEGMVKETHHESTPDTVLGAFRTECKFSHFAYDDPLVYPNMPGMSHLHMFFGNTAVDAFTDPLQVANSGNSTCDGGVLNRSAYWIPAMLDTKKREPVLPIKTLWYYKGGYQGLAKVGFDNLPKGLGMIARDYNWSCSSNPTLQVDAIPECSAGEYINLAVMFPQCWDGVNLWLNNSEHVVNPVSRQCPSSHPVPIPRITMTMKFLVEYEGQTDHLALSSDMMQPAGSSAHADWINGWDEDTSAKFVENCLNKLNNCHSNLLGDGTILYQ